MRWMLAMSKATALCQAG